MSSQTSSFRLSTALALLMAAPAVVTPIPALAQAVSNAQIIVEGNQRVDAGTIISRAGLASGGSFSAAQLNAAYQSLINTGLFQSVTVTPRGNTVVIAVLEQPTINQIAIEGNDRLKDEDLLGIISSQSRRVFSRAQAEEDAQRVANAYRQEGRLAATVTPKIIERSDNRVDLVFEVTEGKVVENERISFVGNRAYSDSRLRRVLQTKQAGFLRRFISEDSYVAERIPFDRRVLTDFYQSRGYIDFTIADVTAELTRARDATFVTFQIREGQQFRIGGSGVSSDVPGVDAASFASRVNLRRGAVYTPTDIDENIARLEEAAIKRGLDFISAEPIITRNDAAGTLYVDFRLVRGPRVFIERIDIEGNQTTLDRVIRRQFTVVEGDPFNPREIRAAAERIRALGYFQTAEVDARSGTAPDQVIVDVDVEEKPTGSLSFGGSYSASGGFGFALEFAERNFLGRGQTVQAQLNTSKDTRKGRLFFSEPALLGRDLQGSIDIYYTETDQASVTYNTNSGGISPAIGFPISPNGRVSLRYSLSADEMEIVDAEKTSPILVREEGRRWTSAVGYTYTWDSRRSGFEQDEGVRFSFGQDFAGLGGDNTYVKTTASVRGQKKVRNDEITLFGEIEAGALHFSDGSSRAIDRFYLGGSKLRGFKGAGLGPRDIAAPRQDSLGGDYYIVARAEARFPLGLPEEYGIEGGVFADVGSVWGLDDTAGYNGTQVDDSAILRASLGVSLFWDTPIGPLRFNYAKPIASEDYDEEQAFDLTIQTRF